MGRKIEKMDFSKVYYFEMFKRIVQSICPKLFEQLELGILWIETKATGENCKRLYVKNGYSEIGINPESEYVIGELLKEYYLPLLDEAPYSGYLEQILRHIKLQGKEDNAYEILSGAIVEDVLLAFVVFSDQPEEFGVNVSKRYSMGINGQMQKKVIHYCIFF